MGYKQLIAFGICTCLICLGIGGCAYALQKGDAEIALAQRGVEFSGRKCAFCNSHFAAMSIGLPNSYELMIICKDHLKEGQTLANLIAKHW
jgi:hypothetical protein